MKLQIKKLNDELIEIDVDEKIQIFDLKKEICKHINNIQLDEFRLVHAGNHLIDQQNLQFYPFIKDGSKIAIVLKKNEANLNETLEKFLNKWYSKEQSTKIAEEFMKEFREKADNLSLDDLERIAIAWYSDGPNQTL